MMTDNIYYYEPQEPRGKWQEGDCPDCNGDGFDGDGYPCRTCDNTGYVEVWVDYDPDDAIGQRQDYYYELAGDR